MAIKLIANYSKRLGLPGYSSHQFSVSVETELVATDDVAAESQRLYQLLQTNVDEQIIQTGFVPPPSYGMEEAYGAGGYGGGGAAMRGSRGGSFGGMAPRGGPRSGYGGGGFGEDEWGGGGFVGGGRGSFGGGEGHSLAFSDAAGGGSMESTQVSNSENIGITGSCECEIKHF